MRKMVIWLAVTPILAVAWGCKGEPAWKGSVETADGIQVVRNPKAPMYPQEALELQEELTIGMAEGAEEYMFAGLRGIAVDDQGEIFALDQRKPRADVFSGDGSHIRSIGRRGQGPGEFQTPFFIALAPAGELLVGDMSRLSFFERSGDFLRSQNNSIGRLAFVKYLENGDAVGTRMVMDEKNPRYEAAICGRNLEPKSVLASSTMPETSGKFALFVSVIRWDISRGREIVCASGQEGYRLSIFNAGGRSDPDHLQGIRTGPGHRPGHRPADEATRDRIPERGHNSPVPAAHLVGLCRRGWPHLRFDLAEGSRIGRCPFQYLRPRGTLSLRLSHSRRTFGFQRRQALCDRPRQRGNPVHQTLSNDLEALIKDPKVGSSILLTHAG